MTARRGLVETLREQLASIDFVDRKHGDSINAFAKECGVDGTCLRRFMDGKGSLSAENADKLMKHLGITIRVPKGN